MVVHGNFYQNWGLCGHLSSTRGWYNSPHICFLAIDHILGFLVETISWSKFVRVSLQYYWKWSFMLFSTKWGLCGHWSSTRGSYTSPHICFLAIDRILGFLVETISLGKNPNVLAFGIIENGRSWLFSTKMGVVWPLIFDQRLIHLTTHIFPGHRSHSWIYGGDHFLVKNP
jgi:hypothetical protein